MVLIFVFPVYFFYFHFFLLVNPEAYISVQTNCTYTYINKQSGRLASPNYPKNYGNKQNCYWLLTSNEMIALSFESFETEDYYYDNVYVYDGISSSSKLLGQYNGNKIPPKLISSTNQLYVRFTSYYKSVTKRGFSAKYGPAGQGKFTSL